MDTVVAEMIVATKSQPSHWAKVLSDYEIRVWEEMGA